MNLSDLYRTVVPTNGRMLLETVMGNRSPITNKDFSPQELQALREIYLRKQAENAQRAAAIPRDTLSEDQYNQSPQNVLAPVPGSTMLVSRPQTYPEYIQGRQAQTDSYNKDPSKTSVSYFDYPNSQSGAPTYTSWPDAIKRSYTDPAFNIQTTLGSFNGYDRGDKVQVEDTYKFDNSGYYNTNKDTSLLDMFNKATGPVSLGDMMMQKYYGDVRRPVNLEFDK